MINSSHSNLSLLKGQIDSLPQSSLSNSQSLISVINITHKNSSNVKKEESLEE